MGPARDDMSSLIGRGYGMDCHYVLGGNDITRLVGKEAGADQAQMVNLTRLAKGGAGTGGQMGLN